ncbi:TonB-dependent receptor [Massilia sp. RP-1-19]|uniref:TonB-dependent receptor n=1 Tax=Massilia polaris TaxID=2728846 RepID=A0A848HQP6_9BURK|nr:TonB-dependent receptor [Massilia polaris]NML63287.1 TonB-dependent receptor [Massilia polaris]
MLEKALARSIRLICLGGVTLGMSAAFAQTATPEIQKVTVTGSRISSPNAESPSPLQVLSSADIAQSGATNLQELLLENPTMGTPSISRTNSNFSTASAGVATVDLRNLGVDRTLVLINGRRVVSGVPGSAAVDLNTIPTDFIERVELLTGGASATYGSDAVAGVVNIILKKNFNGVLADASVGGSEQGDDAKRKLSLTFGTTSADGASNIMGHFGYSRQGAVFSKDRDISAVDQYSEGALTGNAADLFKPRRPYLSGYAPQGYFYHDTGSYTYDAAGNPIPVSTNGSATQAPTGYNRSEFRTIAVPTERYNFATSGNLALNENHSAFFEGNYASTSVTTKLEPFALGSDDIYANGQVPAETFVNGAAVRNPLVPQYLYDRISDTDGDGLRDYFFTRRMAEVGNRGSTAERDTFRLATGLKGTIKDWNYEVYGVYGSTKEAQASGGQVNVLNFRNALQAVPGADGTPMCADATARAQGCVPINVFGFNAISPAAFKYVNAPGSLETVTTQKLIGGSISGEPFQLPAGALGIAAGYEWRKEFSSSTPDALTQAGLNAGNATPPTAGEFEVKEAFLETRIPILKDKAFAKSLSFLGAVRVGDYSTVGNTTSWNGGFEWSPVQDIKLRATRALSTRAPNINELFSPPSQDFPSGLKDPCEGVTATSAGARDDACRAAPGVNANIAANGAFSLNQSDLQGVSGFNRGNPGLGEEEGRSTTVGIVVTPRSIPSLSKFTFTADYFKIDIEDAIVSTPRQYALDSCYGGGNTSFCNFITRRPAAAGANSAGSLEFIDSAVSNSGGLGTKGVDVTVAWADKVGPGRLNARLAYTHLLDGYDIPLPGAERDPWEGEIGAAKDKASLSLGYKWGAFNLTSSTTYIGKSALDNVFLGDFDLAPGSVKVKEKVYNDFQLTYAMRKEVDLYVGVDNAFNTKAPPIISGLPGNTTGAETDAGTYDPIGRRYYLGLRVKM